MFHIYAWGEHITLVFVLSGTNLLILPLAKFLYFFSLIFSRKHLNNLKREVFFLLIWLWINIHEVYHSVTCNINLFVLTSNKTSTRMKTAAQHQSFHTRTVLKVPGEPSRNQGAYTLRPRVPSGSWTTKLKHSVQQVASAWRRGESGNEGLITKCEEVWKSEEKEG